ncbi:MAG: NAD(P)H-binding protein [Solirubrobacterales bacterium]|nr:NAD(P)H-binding protein [Solirubrobacterales bacterium]
MRILLTGASGYVGSELLPRLCQQGHEVRALARDPARVVAAAAPTSVADRVEVVRGDALTAEGLPRALDGVEVAYYLIHSMEGLPSIEPARFPERERAAAHNFARAARRSGVARIVYLGGMVPHARPLSRHLASRHALERVFQAAVPDSLALRASIIVGARSRSFRLLVRLIERMPVLTLPAWRRFRTQPIDGRDVTELLLSAATAPQVGGLSLDIAGPDVLSYEQIITGIAEEMLVARPALRVGVSATPITARVVASLAREDPALIVPLMEGLECDLLARDTRAFELLGVPRHSFHSAVEHALGQWERAEPLAAR